MYPVRDKFSYFKYKIAFSFGLMDRELLDSFPMFAFFKKTALYLVLGYGVSIGC